MLVLSSDVIYTIINILILAALLRIFLWRPVLNIIERRRETIQNDLDQAAESNRQAREAKARYETSLAEARREGATLVQQAQVQAGAKYDAILAQANQEAAALLEQARQDAQAEKEQLMDEARGELADVAILAASKLLGTTVDQETDRAMLDAFLREAGGQI